MAYTPLHVHTEHSALDGLARLDDLAKTVADAGMSACAITDHGSIAGLWSFAHSAQKHGIKPIPGMEAYLAIGSRHEPETIQVYNDDGMADAIDEVAGRMKTKSYYHLTVLARNRTGWHNLIRLHNESQKTKRGKNPLIDYQLLKQYSQGLVVLTGCLASPVAGPAAQTGVVAQLFLDELDIPTLFGPVISHNDIAMIEDTLEAYTQATRGADRGHLKTQLDQRIDAIGRRTSRHHHDTIAAVINEAVHAGDDEAIDHAINELQMLADDVHQGATDDQLADIEDLIFDAIASGDHPYASQVLQDLVEVLESLDDELLARDFTPALRRVAALRSKDLPSLLTNAANAIHHAAQPVTIDHATINANAIQLLHWDGHDHITADMVDDIDEAIQRLGTTTGSSKAAKQRRQHATDLSDLPSGIIEQTYLNAMTADAVTGLVSMVTERVAEASQLLDAAYQATQQLIDAVGKEHVFVEIMDHGIISEQYAMDHLIPMADDLDLQLVVTNDSHYLKSDDAHAHDAFLAVGTGSSLDTPGRFTFNGGNYHVMSESQIRAINDADYWQRAIDTTQDVADLVEHDTVPPPKTRLPSFALPDGFTSADAYLRHKVEGMAPERYGDAWRDDAEVVDRIDHELSVISDMGFSDYFLITWDIMDFCRQEGITTGAGRGSACGSIISYILGIVHVCPLDSGLLFERFLERGRDGLPDIDLDFPKYQRWKIHEYVGQKYGADHVAQIGSFQSAKSRAAIRNAARVLTPEKSLSMTAADHDRRREIFKLGDELAKMLEPPNGGDPLSFAALDALDDKHPQKMEFFTAVEHAGDVGAHIIELARQMEDISTGVSIHPCGFIISTEPLADMVPLRPAPNENEPDIIIWDGQMCEDMGLLKMDFLAIQNLDYMDRTFQYLADADIALSVHDIPHPNADEPSVDRAYQLLREGRTAGLFQLDSSGMTEVVRDVAPNDLNDLSAVVALYRPGPLSAGMPADYAAKKRGDIPESYAHLSDDAQEVAWLHDVLGETYQAALYQEQAMRLGRVVAGFDDKQRSTLRRAIGKKNKDLMDQVKGWWFEGAGKEFTDDDGTVYSPAFCDDTAQQVWDFIEGAASYSFNKCITGDTVVKTADNSPRTIEQLYRQIHGSGATPDGLCPSCLMRAARPLAVDEICAPCASWRFKLDDNRGFCLLAYDESDGRIRPQRMKTVHYNGEREVFTITFADGSSIRATDNHRFRMTDGYRYVSEIQPGDHIMNHVGNDSCVSHHKKWDYRHNGRTKRWGKGHLAGTLEVVSIHSAGIEPVYDVEMEEGTDHNFIANGVVSHNSHSAAYGVVAYWTAWLKANYPVEYSAAMLAVSDNEDKRLLVIKDLIDEGITIQAPSVNTSQPGSSPVDGQVHLGLAEIRSVGKVADTIVAERDRNGVFSSLHDVATRVKGITTTALKALIEAGAMDEFGSRRGLLKNLYAAKIVDLPVDQLDFGVVERDARQRLVIGTVVGSDTLSAIDLDDLATSIGTTDEGFGLDIHRLDDLTEAHHTACHVGILSEYKSFVSRSGRMAKAELSDGSAMPLVIFNDSYRDMIQAFGQPSIGSLMVVSGQVKTNTWSDDHGEQQATQQILASRVWLPDDPTRVVEEPWQTTMLADAVDQDDQDAEGGDEDYGGADEPVHLTEGHQYHFDDGNVQPDQDEPTTPNRSVADGWVGYVILDSTPGLINSTTPRLLGYLGAFRSTTIKKPLEHDETVLEEEAVAIVLASGDLDADYNRLEQLLHTVC